MSAPRHRSLPPQPGMEVYTADARHVGTVKAINPWIIHIDRSMQRDMLVPLEYVSQVLEEERRVELSLTEAEMDGIDWERPPLTGG